MSASDDIMDGWDIPNREEDWREGFHITRQGDEIQLEDMTDDHLMNTMNYFSDADTRPLRRELERRRKIEITDYEK